MSRKNKVFKTARPARRQDTRLLLPMPRSEADELVLMYRAALEAAKMGYADAPLARRLYTGILLTRFLTDAGHGLLDADMLENADKQLTAIYDRGNETGDWQIPPGTIALLTQALNEHDRQLRDTPLLFLLEASDRLDKIIEKSASPAIELVN